MQQAGMKHCLFFKDDVTSFFGYVCVYIYIYTHTYAARGLTFARNPRNSMDCNLLCSLGACFFANWEHTRYFLRLLAFLRLQRDGAKITF